MEKNNWKDSFDGYSFSVDLTASVWIPLAKKARLGLNWLKLQFYNWIRNREK